MALSELDENIIEKQAIQPIVSPTEVIENGVY